MRANGKRIQELRDSFGLTQSELSQDCKKRGNNISRRTIVRLEKDGAARGSTLRAVADALGERIEAITMIEEPSAGLCVHEGLRPHLRTFNSFIEDHIREFVGREFVFNAFDQFLESEGLSTGYFLITGQPGIGKSAILSQLIHENNLPIHHFNIAMEANNTPQHFLGNICSRLISHYRLPHDVLPDGFDADGTFLSGLLNEISSRVKNYDPLIIAIDALDEAVAPTSTGSNVLFLPATLPENIYVVATSRPLDRYRLPPGFVIFDLDREIENNLGDARTYLEASLSTNAIRNWISKHRVSKSEFVEQLADKSAGNFMYLRHVLPALADGWWDDDLKRLPHGLGEYYKQHWDKMREKDPGSVYEPVVCVLAAAEEPITTSQLSRCTGIPVSKVQAVLNDWRQFLHEEQVSTSGRQYRVYHTSFSDFLRSEIDPDLTRAQTLLANTFLGILKGGR